MIPERTKQTIDDYVGKGWEPGHFVGAVLANDLKGALGAADSNNKNHIFDTVCYVVNKIPYTCHGSYEIVQKWLAKDWSVKNDNK